MGEFAILVQAVRQFAEERGWGRFHTPKNLAMAITGEAGELAAELQWDDDGTDRVAADPQLRERLALEMADILIYLARMADVCEIDAMDAAHRKLTINASRFPAGSSPSRAPHSSL